MKKAKVDQNLCIGCGLCASLCPDVFELAEDGKSRVKDSAGDCDLREAIEICPVAAISFEE